ncbi:MAG: PQQ-binding-like beta-propeller repeat protein, partial [Planctomycetales bacterium]|nr:PQQ-binding-like beta-propeller repeat protein [Planctomycetales bacterium]
MLFRTQLGLFALGLVIVSTFATTHAAAAELRSSGMISTAGARRAGLERAWASAVRMDGGRDRLVGSTLHITSDPQRERRIIEVHYNNRKEIYTDTDVDRYGEVLGKDGVQKKTIARVNDLKAQNIDAKTVEYNVPEMMFFVASRRGFIHAMDAHTGATRWSARIGNPDHPTHGPAANDKYVAVINGNVLYVLKHDDGELAWQKKLSYVPSA